MTNSSIWSASPSTTNWIFHSSRKCRSAKFTGVAIPSSPSEETRTPARQRYELIPLTRIQAGRHVTGAFRQRIPHRLHLPAQPQFLRYLQSGAHNCQGWLTPPSGKTMRTTCCRSCVPGHDAVRQAIVHRTGIKPLAMISPSTLSPRTSFASCR